MEATTHTTQEPGRTVKVEATTTTSTTTIRLEHSEVEAFYGGEYGLGSLTRRVGRVGGTYAAFDKIRNLDIDTMIALRDALTATIDASVQRGLV